MKAHELIELLAKHDSETEVCMTSRIDQGTQWTKINHVGYDKAGNLVITYSDNLVVKTREAEDLEAKYQESQEAHNALAREDRFRVYRATEARENLFQEVRKAPADKYREAQAREDKYREPREAYKAYKTREAQADKDQELINARALYVRQAREAREAYTVQRNAKLARELTLARIDALRHWEDCFLTGVVDDEHRVFIAEVLAEQAKALEENNNEST